jgi:hypothetical protein
MVRSNNELIIKPGGGTKVMNRERVKLTRWWLVVVFAAPMARVESAVVFYLRSMMNRIEPYQPNPLPTAGGFAPVELPRELATLIILFTVGWLAGRDGHAAFGLLVHRDHLRVAVFGGGIFPLKRPVARRFPHVGHHLSARGRANDHRAAAHPRNIGHFFAEGKTMLWNALG